MPSHEQNDNALVARSLAEARETRALALDSGARHQTARVFASEFGSSKAVVVADVNTFRAAGRDVCDSLAKAGIASEAPIIFDDPKLYAEYAFIDQLVEKLRPINAIPIAVGSGTINDLTKMASHLTGRRYMAVATAASMDGYTAYGASITANGSKQTFDCPAPQAVVADVDVIAGAPEGMNASGYADLLAKIAAGADWIAADAVGVEPIDAGIWEMVQGPLRRWVSDPAGIRNADPTALRCLLSGLLVSGFAMQAARTSRPASGADHQFSHLWDMQHHVHNGATPSHGFKVGIGTLASVALYEELFRRDVLVEDAERVIAKWPPLAALEHEIRNLFVQPDLVETALRETRAKYIDPVALSAELDRVNTAWPTMRERLRAHLPTLGEVRDMLRTAGCAAQPMEIGIPLARLQVSYRQAFFIRRRYTVLDLAERTGLFAPALESLFGAGGAWAA